MEKKKLTRFQKITRIVVWLMLIVTVGTLFVTAIFSVLGY
jgi:cell division septal protein FtsQ